MRTLAATLDAAAEAFVAGRLDEAAALYRRAERQAPDDVRAAYSLAVIDLRRNQLLSAQERLESVVAREPGLFPAWHNLAAASQQLRRWNRAAEAYRQALKLQPDAAESRHGLATALAALGRFDEALDHHRRLAAQPATRWRALTRIALLDAGAIDEAEFIAMRAAAGAPGADAETRIGLWFALGEALDARGRDDEAFVAFAEGNRLKRASLGPTVEAAHRAHAAAVDAVRARDTATALSADAGRWRAGAAPIFVVGFPRSGSTLIEQILASLPGVQGLGETGAVSDLAAEVGRAPPRKLAARYLDALRAAGWDGVSRVVDKTLENYLHVGAIVRMFPDAVILHAVRDPIDTGYAAFRQLFASGNETLYGLADIAAEYRRYRAMMARWASVLPGRVSDISYEALVAEPEPQIRRLVVEAAGLPWDQAALRFFEREGAVATASATQVRRPIYATSVQRWRRHEAALKPLIDGLTGPD